MKNNKAITLIALVITIVVMLILAIVTLNLTLGENGIFKRAKTAREEQAKQAATELLKVKMTECQLESIAEKGEYPTLAYLAAYLQNEKAKNGEIEYVEAVSKSLASLDETPYADWEKIYTKLSKYPFEFEIDSSFRVSVNGTEVGIPSGYMKIPTETLNITENGEHDVTNYAKVNVNVSAQSAESQVINNFSITNSELSGLTTTLSINGTISTSDSSSIAGYIILINDKAKLTTNSMPYNLQLERNTQNTIKIKAIDEEGNTKVSTNSVSVTTPDLLKTILDYPLLTTNGVVNVKYTNPGNSNDYFYGLDKSVNCTASDAMRTAAFDGDAETYDNRGVENKKIKFQKGVDPYCILIKIPSSYTSGRVLTESNGYYNYNEGARLTSGNYSGYWHQTYYNKGVANLSSDKIFQITPTVYEICYAANF